MKKGLTEMVFILDESGSMHPLTVDTIGGFNSLIEKQKKEEGEALVSTVFFSNTSRFIHDRIDIREVENITDNDYVPNGCTALFDAVGDAVKHIETIHKYAKNEDVPEKTVFVITTDGMENASRKYTQKDIRKLIEYHQEKDKWEFLFLGANIDAAETAGSIGICEENSVDYIADARGTAAFFGSVCSALNQVRSAEHHSLRSSQKWKECIMEDRESRADSAPSAKASGNKMSCINKLFGKSGKNTRK